MGRPLRFLPLDEHEGESPVRPTVRVLKSCRTEEFYFGTFGDFYAAIDILIFNAILASKTYFYRIFLYIRIFY